LTPPSLPLAGEEDNNNMTQKIVLKIVGYYILLTGGMFLILLGVNWYMLRQEAVRRGMARPNFPYRQYSLDELNKMYPQYPNENVPTRQTPEETYAKFIAALKEGDIDVAASLMTEKNREEYRRTYIADKANGRLNEFVNRIDRQINLKDEFGVFKNYWLEVDAEKYIVHFVKDADGVWKIDSL